MSNSQASLGLGLGLTSTSNRFDEIGQNNVGFSTTSTSTSTTGLDSEDDISQIVSLVIAQLTPQIAEAVQSASG